MTRPSLQTIKNALYIVELMHEYAGVHQDMDAVLRAVGADPQGEEATLLEGVFDDVFKAIPCTTVRWQFHQQMCLLAHKVLEQMERNYPR